MVASRRCLLVLTATIVTLAVTASAQAEPFYKNSPSQRASLREPAPSLLSKEVLLAPMYKLHEGTMKLHAGTMAFHSKVHQGTKKFLVQTASYLSPSNLLPSKKPASRYGHRGWAPKKKKRGAADWLIPSCLKPEEPHNLRTMRDFLSQERPNF